jgi:hypothetical protein
MSSIVPKPPRIFISYSQDSPSHIDQVVAFANRLRTEGVDCVVDKYEFSPPEGWSRWAANQIQKADFVLAVCTEPYSLKFNGLTEKGKGQGVKWEAAVIDREIYGNDSNNHKCIPIVLRSEDKSSVPPLLRDYTCYDVSTDEEYEDLYRRLTHQPGIIKPELGKLRPLPPLQHKGSLLAQVANSHDDQPPIDDSAKPTTDQRLKPKTNRGLGPLTNQRSLWVVSALLLFMVLALFPWAKLYAGIRKLPTLIYAKPASASDPKAEDVGAIQGGPSSGDTRNQATSLTPNLSPAPASPSIGSTVDAPSQGSPSKDPPASASRGSGALPATRQAPAPNIRIRVVACGDQQPLSGVEVTIEDSAKKGAITRADGRCAWNVHMKQGEVIWIQVRKKGYEKQPSQLYQVGRGEKMIKLCKQ